MDLPCASTFWGRRLGESSSVAGDADDDDFQRQLDFSAGYDSEEERQHEMEESLYCQMYFMANSVKSVENSEEESDYRVSDLSRSDLPLKESKLHGEVEQVKAMTQQRNDDSHDLTKANEKPKKSRMVTDIHKNSVEKFSPNKSFEHKAVCSTNFIRIPEESLNSSDVILVPTDSEKSDMASNREPYVIVEDESELEDKAEKQPPEKCKRNRKIREVIDVSDSSSDSSLFLDISSSDDDIDVHMIKSHAACDEGETDEYLEAILNNLPECGWKINNTDRLGSSCVEKSRYYNSASKFRCNNCNQRGHFMYACPEPKKVMACILCGHRGHLARYCRQSLCFRCNRAGHAVKDCDRKRKWHEDECSRCGIQGHLESVCPDNWRQYHFTVISNEIVKGPKLENHRKFCYNCAAVGHFGHECRRRWRESYVQPSTPFIMKYDKYRHKRSRPKDPHFQDESLSSSVAGKQSIESKCQKEGDWQQSDKQQSQTDLSIVERGNEMNQDRLTNDIRKAFGKTQLINSSQCTNFALKIRDKLLDMKKSAKKSPKKRKTARDGMLQLDYLPLSTAVVSGNEGNPRMQRSAELFSELNSSRNHVSYLPRTIASHAPLDGLYAGDFRRSDVKAARLNQNLNEFYKKKEVSRLSDCLAGGYYSKSPFTTPKELKTSRNRFVSSTKSEWPQTSTPADKINGHQQQRSLYPEFATPEASHPIGRRKRSRREFSAGNMQQLEVAPETSPREAFATGRRRKSRKSSAGNMQQLEVAPEACQTGRPRKSPKFFASNTQEPEVDQVLANYSKSKLRTTRRRRERRKKKQALDKASLSATPSDHQSHKKKKSTDKGTETGIQIRLLKYCMFEAM